MAELYISADLHLFNKKEAEQFGMTVEEYNDYIVATWNAIVNKEDTVLLLGEISDGSRESTSQLIAELNGKKKVISLSHQKNFSEQDWLRMGVDDVMAMNGWTRGEINGTVANVMICTTTEFFNDFVKKMDSTTYVAAPSSISHWDTTYKDRVLSLSAKYWNFFPIRYSDLPYLIDNQIFFSQMNDEEEEN